MESAYFEVALFLATVLYLVVQTLRGQAKWTRTLWWPVALSALGGATATLLSIHHAVDSSQRFEWTVFIGLAIALPVILAVVVAILRKSPATRRP